MSDAPRTSTPSVLRTAKFIKERVALIMAEATLGIRIALNQIREALRQLERAESNVANAGWGDVVLELSDIRTQCTAIAQRLADGY